MTIGVTAALAGYVVGARFDEVPAPVRAEAVRTLLNWVGGAVGGGGDPAVEALLAGLGPFMGPAQASLLGRRERVDVLSAALVNGASSNVLDFDDTHLRTVIHPAGPVAPAVLALAEYMPVSGAELLHALILGIEVECRIGNGISPGHYEHGSHITGTCGVFGAAAAAGRLLGLDAQRMRWALSTAATHAAGLRDMFGAAARIIHAGRAAQHGLAAAFLSKSGFASSEGAIEARAGFANVLSPRQDWAAMTEGLGVTWETALNTYKPYATGIVTHPAIDGCLRLKRAHGLAPDDIAEVALDVHPLTLVLTDNPAPATGLAARLSLQHVAATALAYGAAGPSELTDENVAAPGTVALRARVRAQGDETLERDQARVRVTRSDGSAVEAFVEHAYGSAANPMTDADLDAKVHGLCAPVLGAQRADALIALCRDVVALPSAGAIAEAARVG